MNELMSYLLNGWRIDMIDSGWRHIKVWLREPAFPYIYATVIMF